LGAFAVEPLAGRLEAVKNSQTAPGGRGSVNIVDWLRHVGFGMGDFSKTQISRWGFRLGGGFSIGGESTSIGPDIF
jgi:hypothetical protein